MRDQPNISFFCPAYNDEANIEAVVAAASALLQDAANDYEIIIVEDGSPDRTAAVADDLARRYAHVRVIHHPQNLGYGAALKSGFRAARFAYVAYTDGDNQFDVGELRKMIPLMQDGADLVTGYRTNRAVSRLRWVQSRVFNTLINRLFGLHVRDVNCALKIYTKALLDSITIDADSAFIDAEIFIRAAARGCRLEQVGVTHYPRRHGKASSARLGVVMSTLADIVRFYRLRRRGLLTGSSQEARRTP